jgi:glycosyltransferase involved in cell wall biosynthesis
VRKARALIAVSEHTKQDVVRHFNAPPEKIAVIYEGVDPHFSRVTDAAALDATLTRYGVSRPYIFYGGLWRPHKNVDGLVRAYGALLRRHGLPHCLVLGGREHPDYPAPREAWESLGLGDRIVRPGFVADDDMPALYSGADAFVLPSFNEGFGLMPLEAMACGTPVVASNASCVPEILGDAARYVDPRDPDAIAEGLHAVLTDSALRGELIARGTARLDRFSWDRAAEETLAVYERALEGVVERDPS